MACRTDRLDALVFCGGVLSTVPEWAAEGLERNFVLNYLSRYLLARRSLPMLTAATSGRLVLVANAGLYGDSLDCGDLQLRRGKPGLWAAGRTQFANDLLAAELADRLAGTPCFETHSSPHSNLRSAHQDAETPDVGGPATSLIVV